MTSQGEYLYSFGEDHLLSAAPKNAMVDAQGTLYVVDCWNHKIMVYEPIPLED